MLLACAAAAQDEGAPVKWDLGAHLPKHLACGTGLNTGAAVWYRLLCSTHSPQAPSAHTTWHTHILKRQDGSLNDDKRDKLMIVLAVKGPAVRPGGTPGGGYGGSEAGDDDDGGDDYGDDDGGGGDDDGGDDDIGDDDGGDA